MKSKTNSKKCHSRESGNPEGTLTWIPAFAGMTLLFIGLFGNSFITAQGASVPTACTEDTWTCRHWSPECNTSGEETRVCEMTYDCAGYTSPQPIEIQPCGHLQCGNRANVRDRVACRLSLTSAGLAREYELQYLPEECRLVKNEREQRACIDRYRSFDRCFAEDGHEGRIACVRTLFSLTSNVAAAAEQCRTATAPACLKSLRDKVTDLIKFRFLDLEKRAEALMKQGVSKELIADFETAIEEKIKTFNEVGLTSEREQVIVEARAAWRDFVEKVKTMPRQ